MPFPPAVPAIDVAAIRSAAGGLNPLGPAVADGGNRTIDTWRQIGRYYLAPETPVLLAALDPIGPTTRRTADQLGGLSRALTGYADRIEPVLAELRALAATSGPPAPEQVARAGALEAELASAEQDCAAAIRALSATDFAPALVRVGEQVDKAGVAISIGFVKIGESAVFKETTFSDGSVSLTAVDAGELGATGSLGPFLEFGAGVKLENGSTWRFHSQAEADALRQQLDAYVAQQRTVMFDDTGGAAIGVALFGGVPVPRPPDQIITEASIPLTAKLSGDTPLVAGSVKAAGTGKETILRDLATGLTTTTISREGSVNGEVSATPLGLGPSVGTGFGLTTNSATAVTTDATGRITKVALTSTDTVQGSVSDGVTSGKPEEPYGRHAQPTLQPKAGFTDDGRTAHVTITTTTLDVTDQNRAAVESWVAAGRPDGDGAVGDPNLHYPDHLTPGDAFQNALNHDAKVSRVEYDDATRAYGVDASIKAGWKLGVEVDAEQTTTTTDRGGYLGAPDADGTRHPVPLPPPR